MLVTNDSTDDTTREMCWDEDNRLMILSDNGKTSRYTYNAAGERIIKSHGDLEGVYINGVPHGITHLLSPTCTEVSLNGRLHDLSRSDYHCDKESLYQVLLHR
ncbi:hypothetical protein HMPREF9140_01047 [Prevotella micans F0438]|uniref:Uncharacterized protein n=1 Tax=Prevotella micans F0438 TaxID=883158 RepID=H1Q2A9_9BACT|nr:hypothetical protein HMPREF9140_01047 [Prevotella micans F0438]